MGKNWRHRGKERELPLRGTVEVHRYLVERGVPHEFYRLEHPVRRIDEAAALLALDPLIVVAAELFEAPSAQVLALTPSSMCASAEAAAGAVGVQRVRAASKARTSAYTGFFSEWLPPVGHERHAQAVLEPGLLDAEVLYAAGGDPGVMLVIRSADLLRATAAVPSPLATPATLAG